MRHATVKTVNRVLDALDVDALSVEIERLDAEGRVALDRADVAFTSVERIVEFDMLYVGQTHTVTAALGDTEPSIAAIRTAFETAYRAAFGRLLEGVAMKVMNLRVAVLGRRPKFDLASLAPTTTCGVDDCEIGRRRLYADGGWHDAPVYDRLKLPVGAVVTGPAMLEQSDTTIFVDPGLTGRVDAYGNLVMERAAP